jgi:hypothetical protein
VLMYVYGSKTLGGDLREILDPRKVSSKELDGPVPGRDTAGTPPDPV